MKITREQLDHLNVEMVKEAFFKMFGDYNLSEIEYVDDVDVIENFYDTAMYIDSKLEEITPTVDFNTFLKQNNLSLSITFNPNKPWEYCVNIDDYLIESDIVGGYYDKVVGVGNDIDSAIQSYIAEISCKEILNPNIDNSIQCPRFETYLIK